MILSGTINPLPALFDIRLQDFLQKGVGTNTIFAAISSAPLLLLQAGILKDKNYTSGFFMQMAEAFSFVDVNHFIHKPVVEDGNVITGIGMFFREFAEPVLTRLGFDVGVNFMKDEPKDNTEEELTFY